MRGTRTTDAAVTTLRAALPAVVTVTEKSAEARFPGFKGVIAAKKKPTDVVGNAQLGTVPAASTVVLTTTERPARAAGTAIEDDGSGGRQLAEWLVARGLVVAR